MIRLCMILGTLFKRPSTLFRETSESLPFCRHGQVSTTAKSIVSTEHRNIEVPPLRNILLQVETQNLDGCHLSQAIFDIQGSSESYRR
jgi:hypothetical protein